MSQRRPSIASLWLGSAITGLLPRVFEVSRTFLPTVSLEAVVWTSSPQSFMDPQYHRLAPVKDIDGLDMISREDEFRLLFVTDEDSQEYGSPPLSPYPPFGLVNVQNTSLGVRLHRSCDHRPEYHSWNWLCQNGKDLSDFGMSCKSNQANPRYAVDILPSISAATVITCASLYKSSFRIDSLLQKYSTLLLSGTLAVICLLPNLIRSAANEHLLSTRSWLKKKLSTSPPIIGPSLVQPSIEEEFDDGVSEIATRNLFSWTFFAEGIKPEEKTLWKHEWLEFLTERDDNAALSESSSSGREDEVDDQNFDYVRKWQDDVPVEFE